MPLDIDLLALGFKLEILYKCALGVVRHTSFRVEQRVSELHKLRESKTIKSKRELERKLLGA